MYKNDLRPAQFEIDFSTLLMVWAALGVIWFLLAPANLPKQIDEEELTWKEIIDELGLTPVTVVDGDAYDVRHLIVDTNNRRTLVKNLQSSLEEIERQWQEYKAANLPDDWDKLDAEDRREEMIHLWTGFWKPDAGYVTKLQASLNEAQRDFKIMPIGLRSRYDTVYDEAVGKSIKALIIEADKEDGLEAVLNEFSGVKKAEGEWVFIRPGKSLYDHIASRAVVVRARCWSHTL
jgi:hypothetical protein